MARTRLVALPVCALVLALAACGGGGTHRLTKEEYDAKVSHLCLLAADQFREMHLENTLADWQYNANRIVRIRIRFDNALAALKAPPSIKTDAAEFLASNKNALDDDRHVIGAARGGDRLEFLHALRSEHGDYRFAYHTAEAIGATGCYIP
jgi:hypothetical protein